MVINLLILLADRDLSVDPEQGKGWKESGW